MESDEQEENCDGLHAEGAPPQYLCTRCFPELVDRPLSVGGDLSEPDDDDYAEDRRDEVREME